MIMNNFVTASETDIATMKLAKKRVKAKEEFMWHLASYILVNTFLVLLYLFTYGGYFWPIWPMAGWGLGLAFHAVSVHFTLSSTTTKDKVMAEYNRLKQAEKDEIAGLVKDIEDRSN